MSSRFLPSFERPHAADDELPRMGLLDHLEELRRRILRSLLAFVAAFFLCWAYSQQIFDFLQQPILPYLGGKKLVFLGVTDPFLIYVKVAALAGTFLSSPMILFQIWRFVSPGLYRRERHLAAPFIFFGSLLFVAGGAFAYYVAFPFAVEFLLKMGEQFEATVTVDRYLGFLMTVMLGLGLMFELPTLIFFFARLGLVTPRFLMRHFRWAVLIIFTAAAIITPTPDVVNLLIFALPTIALYLIGVAVAALFARPQPKPEDEGADE